MKSEFCIKCNKEIQSVKNMWWNGGIVNKIIAGYGSKLDGDVYLISICDECTKKYLEKVGSVI